MVPCILRFRYFDSNLCWLTNFKHVVLGDKKTSLINNHQFPKVIFLEKIE